LTLPPYINAASIRQRLQTIFPEGVPQRAYCIEERAPGIMLVFVEVVATDGPITRLFADAETPEYFAQQILAGELPGNLS
jgi:hypothetical protein